MVTMHGLFDLVQPGGEAEFRSAFDRFAEHLFEQRLIVSWRFMRRLPHYGYDSTPPSTRFHVSMDFDSELTAQQCWDYVEQDLPPVRELHRAVNSRVTREVFFLCEDVV